MKALLLITIAASYLWADVARSQEEPGPENWGNFVVTKECVGNTWNAVLHDETPQGNKIYVKRLNTAVTPNKLEQYVPWGQNSDFQTDIPLSYGTYVFYSCWGSHTPDTPAGQPGLWCRECSTVIQAQSPPWWLCESY